MAYKLQNLNMEIGESQQMCINIHRARILQILNRTIEKIGITFCLDDLMKGNGQRIKHLLPQSDFNAVLEAYVKFAKTGSMNKITHSSIKPLDKYKFKRTSSLECKTELLFSNMLATLHHCPGIMELVNSIIMSKPFESLEFLSRMDEFHEYFTENLNMSADEEYEYNKRLGQAWKMNKGHLKRIQEMTQYREKSHKELLIKLDEKKKLLENYKKKIEVDKINSVQSMQIAINESERAMERYSIETDDNEVHVKEDARIIHNQYQNMVDSHMAHEKQLRVKRYKVETVLSNWLTKYDQDVGDLQKQLEDLTDEFNADQAKYDELKRQFDEQEVEYETLMEEKREEEQLIFDRKRYAFIMNRSARFIQRWWREILARRRARRKKKPKDKKK